MNNLPTEKPPANHADFEQKATKETKVGKLSKAGHGEARMPEGCLRLRASSFTRADLFRGTTFPFVLSAPP